MDKEEDGEVFGNVDHEHTSPHAIAMANTIVQMAMTSASDAFVSSDMIKLQIFAIKKPLNGLTVSGSMRSS